MVEIRPDQYFRLSDGRALRSLDELRGAIPSIPDDQFKQYVNEEKNDFANWIRFVFKYERTASTLAQAKTKSAFLDALDQEMGKGAA